MVSGPRALARHAFWLALAALPALAQAPAEAPRADPRRGGLLVPWHSFTGGIFGGSLDASPPRPGEPLRGSYVNLVRPVAVCGLLNDVYIADAGAARIYRYEFGRNQLTAVTGVQAFFGTRMWVAQDRSLYVLDVQNRRVVHYNAAGRQIQVFANMSNLGIPNDMVYDEPRGLILVADQHYNRVAAYPFGASLSSSIIFVQDAGGQPLRGITAMASGPEGLYLVQGPQRRVLVTDMNGLLRYTLGEGQLGQPGAIAVDEFGRVFVADGSDGSIKVFQEGKLVYSSAGAMPPVRASALAVRGNVLYAVNASLPRVEMLRVMPPLPPGGAR